MTAKKKKPDRKPKDLKAGPQEGTADAESQVRLPDQDIAHRPQMKVKPIGSRPGVEPATPRVRRGTLFRTREGDEDPAPAERTKPPKKVILPPPHGAETRYPFATHRPAPPDEKAEVEELAAVTGVRPAREVSTGFVLGVALIVVVLLGGIIMVRLGKKVGSLEQRISRLETTELQTAAAPLLSP